MADTNTAVSTEEPTDTTPEELREVLSAAANAAEPFGTLSPAQRATLLRGIADALDAASGELVTLAIEESHLPEGRLTGELKRTTFQLRLLADELDDGAYLEATIDTADPNWGMGPRPDIRRYLIPLGPTVVYAASNFPFAFSVAGGDTASALAAGCPVILKAHPGHPRLSARTGAIVASALVDHGAPEGTFAVIFGVEPGVEALKSPQVKAGAFTGSIPGGRALFDVASGRPEPIPFYGELGSLNPVFATPGAVAERGADIASGYVGSYTLGVGQFCTKPGLLFLPSGHGLEDQIVAASREVAPQPLLNERIGQGFATGQASLRGVPGVETLVEGTQVDDLTVTPTLVRTTLANLLERSEEILEERFGPLSVIVEYDGAADLVTAAEAFGGNLTATVHGEESEARVVAPLLDALRDRSGRVLWNGWPTGVTVSYAQHHGGPWPATTASVHTSVGTSAIRRFLRPVAYQDMPQALLPQALRDRNELGIPRRINGTPSSGDVTP